MPEIKSTVGMKDFPVVIEIRKVDSNEGKTERKPEEDVEKNEEAPGSSGSGEQR